MNNDFNLEVILGEWGDSLCTAIDNGEVDENLYFEPFATYVIGNYEQNKYDYQKAVAKFFEDMKAVGITILPERSGEHNNDLTLLAYYQENIDKVDNLDN